MNKAELVKKLADHAGITQEQVHKIIDELAQIIVADVHVDGNSLTIPRLGTFRQKKSAARMGRNPKTGASIQIAASTSIGFKMSSSLK